MPTKLQRHLDLIAYLVGRRVPVPVEELMEKLEGYSDGWRSADQVKRESARRMFERDKDDLRAAGIPLRTVRYSINYGGEEIEGYEITRRDFYLPYLKLVSGQEPRSSFPERGRAGTFEICRDDVPLALQALRVAASVPGFPLIREAKSALRKLAFDLDPDEFGTRAPILFLDRGDTADLRERLRKLSEAVLARRRVRFGYHGIYRNQDTQRDVAGYGLLYQHGNWYLIGHDATRGAIRVFRVSRMHDVAVSKRKDEYQVPDDFRLRDYVGRKAWELGDDDDPPIRALVHFRFPQSLWAERNAYGELVETRADGSSVRAYEVHQVNPFLRWVLGQEGDADVLEPEALRQELRVLARAVADAHTRGADDRD